MATTSRSAPGKGPLNPARLDVAALADQAQRTGAAEGAGAADGANGVLAGRTLLATFERLQAEGEPPAGPTEMVEWQARAQWRPVRGGAPELWLHLAVKALVGRTCQRCLHPVALQVQAERDFLFAPSEERAAAWDAERDDADVLVLTSTLNLVELVEDELLLALPLVPRHEACPEPWLQPPAAADAEPDPEEKPNPFAVLAQLKGKR
ncbi:MAG: YceD family protein [Burkholderiaceae bacterium]